ncbi:hypothetical protein [Rhodococcus sp. NBC_00294]|uniref:hypothetical protein n=1 Tax=Rhodococcus sp. NBC_00294 TaxID=2976004 RepID=UPI002E28AC09|nr:hypothetical protein [Rhodococcus sp. NBC_00294]
MSARNIAAVMRTEIPTDSSPKTPPAEVTAGLEQVGAWFYWGVVATLAMLGVAAGIYLATAYHRGGQLGEGEKRAGIVAVAAVLVAGSGGWAGIVL